MASSAKSDRVWLGRSEAAKHLGVSTKTLYRWTRARRIECYMPTATRVLYDREVLDDFIASRTQPAR